MKHVSLFAPSLRGGGAERVMVALAKELSSKGLTVDLVLAKAEGPYLVDVPPAVNIIDLNVKRIAYAIPPLTKYINTEKPDCLLSTLRHANIIAIAAKLISKHRFTLGVREANTLKAQLENDNSIKEKVLPLFMRFLYRRADVVVAVSRDVKSDLVSCIDLPDNKVVVINNPVVNDDLYSLSEASTDHPWLDQKTVPVILSVGRLTKQKDFVSLIRAFAHYVQHHPARLVILGEGEERQHLEALIHNLNLGDKVSMPGFVSNPFSFMKKSDLFVLSSLWEGQPNALIQALALGVPIISTDCPGGSRDILRNGEYGLLVPVNSVVDLCHAFETTLNTENNAFSRPAAPNDPATYCQSEFGIRPVANQYMHALNAY